MAGSKPFGLCFLSLQSHLPCLMCSCLLLYPSLEASILCGLRDSLERACSKCKRRIVRIADLTLYNVHLILSLGQVGYNSIVLGSCFSPMDQITCKVESRASPCQSLDPGSPRCSHMLPAGDGDVPVCLEQPEVGQQAGTLSPKLSPASCGSSLRKESHSSQKLQMIKITFQHNPTFRRRTGDTNAPYGCMDVTSLPGTKPRRS